MINKFWNRSFIRFAAVGIVNTAVDFVILNILVFGFSLNKIPANMISVSVAMLVSYALNYRIVFRNTDAKHGQKLVLFVAITMFGLFILQNLVIYLFVHTFTGPASIVSDILSKLGIELSQNFILLNTAKILATVVTMIWNFLMYRKFVFGPAKPTRSD